MGDIVVRVENLGKRYFIGGKQDSRYRTFREALGDTITAPVRRLVNVARGRTDSAAGLTDIIWALKDVSFDVKHGEVVGIIGRNGAGKSTLLKVLSRITEPTEGRVLINGRVGALLEVGTGFHPELTGRENIYLNAAILGMKRKDIERKFDEIVAFAEIDRFIDTPVKHYSSGMGLRLGFAVAAYLEPEILIVDEVLAVGDVNFQRKCLGKMDDVARSGRTVLFVSHNLSSISLLTQRSILLSQGIMVADGPTQEIVSKYLAEGVLGVGYLAWTHDPPGDDTIELLSVRVGNGHETEFSGSIPIDFVYRVHKELLGLRVGFDLISGDGVLIFRAYHDDNLRDDVPMQPGVYRSTCVIPGDLLNQGRYSLTLRAGIQGVRRIVLLENALSFDFVNQYETKREQTGSRPGVINPELGWEVTPQGDPVGR